MEEVRNLLEECQNVFVEIEKDRVCLEDVGDDLELLLRTRGILVSSEINIRRLEGKFKVLRILLKESEDYKDLKTIKAKEEKVVVDTHLVTEELLKLKEQRNKLRYRCEYLDYRLKLRLKEGD